MTVLLRASNHQLRIKQVNCQESSVKQLVYEQRQTSNCNGAGNAKHVRQASVMKLANYL